MSGNAHVERLMAAESNPMHDLVGFRVTGWDTDYARLEMPISPQVANRHGLPHGGLYAMLLDSAIGFAGVYTGDPDRPMMAMTLSLTTNFLSQPRGTRLIVEGRRIGGGRSTFFGEAEVRDETGERLATGTGVFRYRKGGG